LKRLVQFLIGFLDFSFNFLKFFRLPKAKIQKLAISAFNEDYKKGVQSLIDACLLENSAEDFARFLLKNNDLKKVFGIKNYFLKKIFLIVRSWRFSWRK